MKCRWVLECVAHCTEQLERIRHVRLDHMTADHCIGCDVTMSAAIELGDERHPTVVDRWRTDVRSIESDAAIVATSTQSTKERAAPAAHLDNLRVSDTGETGGQVRVDEAIDMRLESRRPVLIVIVGGSPYSMRSSRNVVLKMKPQPAQHANTRSPRTTSRASPRDERGMF